MFYHLKKGSQHVKKNITQVAKDLNLSVGTVSKIVNNKGNISDETRARVLDYVRETGYIADNSARILKSKKSWTIGVIYSDISLVGFEHPFFSKILQSFKSTVEKEGYDIVLIVSKLGKNEMTYLEWCKNKKVDGILIVMGNINNPNIIEVVSSDYPCVSTDIIMPNLRSIISDDYQGIKIAIDHAVELGHHKISILSGPTSSRSFVTRIEAYRSVMKNKGLAFSDEDICISNGFDDKSAFHTVQDWLKNKKEMPEYLLVTSDVMAFGVIRGIQNMGYQVPEDINVIGFDDIDFSRHFTPNLSTISQDTTKIGEEAAKELLDAIEKNKKGAPEVIRVPVKLVKRDTTTKSKNKNYTV
jgi:DNA-binding LacI/PurR family transcriptional regulator